MRRTPGEPVPGLHFPAASSAQGDKAALIEDFGVYVVRRPADETQLLTLFVSDGDDEAPAVGDELFDQPLGNTGRPGGDADGVIGSGGLVSERAIPFYDSDSAAVSGAKKVVPGELNKFMLTLDCIDVVG